MIRNDPQIEAIAKIIYDLLPFYKNGFENSKPDWVERGNSTMQDECRRAAYRIRDVLLPKENENEADSA